MRYLVALLVLVLTTRLSIQKSKTWIQRITIENSNRPLYCNPVVCPAGYQVSICKQNYNSDYCHRCPVGSVQGKAVDSATVNIPAEIPKCVLAEQPSCPPEALPVFSDGRPPTCECDTSRGFAGDNFWICIKCSECPPGTELKKDGQCSCCPPGTFKPSQGYGPCKRLTNCEAENREKLFPGNTAVDAVCGKFLTTVTTEATYPTPKITTHQSQLIKDGLSSDDLDGFSLTGDENNQIHSSHGMDMHKLHEVYNNQQRFILVTMAIQIIFLVAIISAIIVALMKFRKVSRDLLTQRRKGVGKDVSDSITQRGKGVGKDEECLLVTSPSDNITGTARIDKTYGLDKYESERELVSLYQPESERELVSLYQPVTMETVYPEINSRPCTPTAPGPSLLVFQNKC